MIKLIVPGEPYAWKRSGRTAHLRKDGRILARSYEPSDQREWKAWIRLLMLQAMDGRPPIQGPVWIDVLFIFGLPQSRHIKRGKRPRSWYVGRKDIDNCYKGLADVASGIVFVDDRQVVQLNAIAVVGEQGEPARVELIITQAPSIDTAPARLIERPQNRGH